MQNRPAPSRNPATREAVHSHIFAMYAFQPREDQRRAEKKEKAEDEDVEDQYA